jgi:tetratricopeptide (TPR) repeat protein
MKRSLMALVCSMALAAPVAALADGGGGSGGGGGGGDSTTAAMKDPEYQAAMTAVANKDWKQVVERMGAYAQRNPDNADAWNELGHAHRRLGNMNVALDSYGKALKIDPKHRGAHEYLGEAYLQMGELAKAEQELKVLDGLCFFPCEQFTDLKEAIGRYKSGKQAQSGS